MTTERQLATLQTSGERGGKVREDLPEPIDECQARDHAAGIAGNKARRGSPVPADLPEPIDEGDARDQAAKTVGVGAKLIAIVDPKAHFQSVLAQADDSFASTGDALEALGWVALATKAGLPLPPRIGRWLSAAIHRWKEDEKTTLDAELGLNQPGPANSRRRSRALCAKQGALAQMMILEIVGATIPQAAAMVARLSPTLALATLVDRYRRSVLHDEARAPRPLWRLQDVEKILAQYPDGGEHKIDIAAGKAAIRALYAKPPR